MAAGITDDPFASTGVGRTFALPTPGMRTRTVHAATPPRAPPEDIEPGAELADAGLNPLVRLANPLLAMYPRLRASSHCPDPSGTKDMLVHALQEFEAQGQAQGLPHPQLLAARYVLCTLLDEAAASTPWGGAGLWSRQNLLVTFHNEAYGGEKVFQLMAKLAEQPAQNLDLLELIYVALALGLEGRFKVAEGGRQQLEAIRARLADIICQQRGDYSPALAQHWQGQRTRRPPYLSWLPLWVTGAVAALALVGGFLFLSYRLGAQSDPVFAGILALNADSPTAAGAVPAAAPVAAPPAAQTRLAPLLQPDIQARWLTVRDERDRSVVTLAGDGLFAAGSATLAPERAALVLRVAQAAASVGTRVLVTGHTDNQAIRSARFPSNWQLSQERAASVRALLLQSGWPADVVRAEGRADGEPIADNTQAAGRAANRRVELIVSGLTHVGGPR